MLTAYIPSYFKRRVFRWSTAPRLRGGRTENENPACMRLEVKIVILIFIVVFFDQNNDYDNDHETLSIVLKFPTSVRVGLKQVLQQDVYTHF